MIKTVGTSVLCAIVVLAAACGSSKKKEAAPPPADASAAAEAMAQMKGFADKMCACKDQACADKVEKDMNDWSEATAAKFKDYKPSESEMKDAEEATKKLQLCMEKLAAPPTTPPAGSGSADMPPPAGSGSGSSDTPPAAGSADPAPAAGGGEGAAALAKLTEFADKMCACKDKACAEGVNKQMNDWMTTDGAKFKDYKPTDAEMKQATDVSERLGKCTVTAMGGATP